MVKEAMESVMELDVPLKVNTEVGGSERTIGSEPKAVLGYNPSRSEHRLMKDTSLAGAFLYG
ncbi:MAG: hypothetical protein D3914_11720 [Candidatus Electrothrix sp. LOE2]|nr:hypothetical protein [Candidatus Electrothrix sp. LOE2]